ncbi:hypothetical protein LIA77_11581 [Sarocladium implicatum]|nr:hypothetical protein LIA77_11581 [Sarocladium implicatum]
MPRLRRVRHQAKGPLQLTPAHLFSKRFALPVLPQASRPQILTRQDPTRAIDSWGHHTISSPHAILPRRPIPSRAFRPTSRLCVSAFSTIVGGVDPFGPALVHSTRLSIVALQLYVSLC